MISTVEVTDSVIHLLCFQGTLKGLLPDQLEALGCQIMLGNTYHLGTRPVIILLLYNLELVITGVVLQKLDIVLVTLESIS
jgi:hypothetical protein